MSDRLAVVLALAAAAGAAAARSVPLPLFGALILATLLSRARVTAVLLVGLLASGLAAHGIAGLHVEHRGPAQGWATVLSDPRPFQGAITADVKLGGSHFEAIAHDEPAASRLAATDAGQRVLLEGKVSPYRRLDEWQVGRHLAGTLAVHTIVRVNGGTGFARTANALRAVLERGCERLTPDVRSLYLGLTIGDDRGEDAATAEAFRRAGLTHLLAVSGENVAFVLVVAGPLLRRLGLAARLVATLSVLLLFAAITRFEPSVMRATVMAAAACVGSTTGRPTSPVRHLAYAVLLLVLVDPLLVHSLGFRLSVGACTGIVLLARPVAARLRGPTWIREPMGVTLAAQIGVAPVAIPAFGGLPLAALPANLLAAPVAGLVTAWGMSGGLLAGTVPPLAPLLQVPTRVAIGWVAGVARVAASWPIPWVRAPSAVALAVVVVLAALARRALVGTGVASAGAPPPR